VSQVPYNTVKWLAILHIREARVRISAQRPCILRFAALFSRVLQTNANIVPQSRPRPLPSTYFAALHSSVILPFVDIINCKEMNHVVMIVNWKGYGRNLPGWVLSRQHPSEPLWAQVDTDSALLNTGGATPRGGEAVVTGTLLKRSASTSDAASACP
jgi:hypothetical protein